ncbi:MAG: branched-chain amino acid transport system ATP-binding protein [Actinomycetota bacterium]|jgi:branched-chain amino acid transport system ATP-binding protein|nr:branched-chain amino acid transport system ATP-binding protein [Actinomycetota bacterium]
MSLLRLDGVVAGYGRVRVLHGLSLSVDEGQIVSLLGANGVGKTTTLKVISGLLAAKAGTVSFDGVPLGSRPADAIARAGIAHVPEGRGIFATLTVGENLQLGGRRLRSRYAAELEQVFDLFPRLSQRLGQRAGTLSGGEQQMLAIGRALLQQPRLLMIDELSLGLAPVVLDELFPVLPRIAASGTAVLLVEQFVGRALQVAGYAYLLEKGRVQAHGSPTELSQDQRALESAYLGGARATAAAHPSINP